MHGKQYKMTVNELKDLEHFLDFEDEVILNFYNFNINEKNIEKNDISQLFKKFKI